MTRYELLEAWLTPQEWAIWKREVVKCQRVSYNTTSRRAIEHRKVYLNTSTSDIFDDSPLRVFQNLVSLTTYYLTNPTPELSLQWSSVISRTQPIRTL